MAFQTIRRALLKSIIKIKLKGVSTVQANPMVDLAFQLEANAVSTISADPLRLVGEQVVLNAESTLALGDPNLVLNEIFQANATSSATIALPPLRMAQFAGNAETTIAPDAFLILPASSIIDGKSGASAEYLRIVHADATCNATSTLQATIELIIPPADYRINVTPAWRVSTQIDGIEFAPTGSTTGMEMGEFDEVFIPVRGIDIFGSNHEG